MYLQEQKEPIHLMRHGEDERDKIDGQFDNSLSPRGRDQSASAAFELIHDLQAARKESINIYTSPKRRAIETTDIVEEILTSAAINVERIVLNDLKELYQGEIKNLAFYSHDQQVQIINDSWQAYNIAVRSLDLRYRFGSSHTDSGTYHTALNGIYSILGENQLEFTVRIYRAYRELLSAPQSLEESKVMIAHLATVTKGQRILGVLNSNTYPYDDHPLYIQEREIETVHANHGEIVTVSQPLGKCAIKALDYEIMRLSQMTDILSNS